MSTKPCGICPACLGQTKTPNECDRVLERKLLKSMSPIFALLVDPNIPPHKTYRELMGRDETNS